MPGPSRWRRSGGVRVRLVARVVAGALMIGGGLLLLLQAYFDG